MRQIIISENDLKSIKFNSNEDNAGYLQIFYNDLNISSTANAIVHKILKDHKPDNNKPDNINDINIKDNYGLVGDNRKPLEPSMGLNGQDIKYISWSSPYEIINLNTCNIINETSTSSNPQTDHTEKVIYINNRVVITGQIIDTISRENNPDLMERLKHGDVVEITDETKYLYIFKYNVYLHPVLNISNNPDNLIKISEITILDDDEDINEKFSNYTSRGYIIRRQMDIGVEQIDCLNSIQSILDKNSFKLDPILDHQFISLQFDLNSISFLLNIVTGHELEDEFIFRKPDGNLDPNRILIRESTDPIREDIHEYNMKSIIRAGYEASEAITIDSNSSRYVLIEKKPHDNTSFDLEIKIYDDLEDLYRNLQEQDKKQLVNLDDYRNIEQKESIQKFNTVTTLENLFDSYSGFGNQEESKRAYIKSEEINNKLSEDLTYGQLKKSEIMNNIADKDKDLVVDNLEVLFDSMNHADNLGHIKVVYRTLSILADSLKNLITPEEEQDLVNKINQYKDYIYINQQEITAADIFNINEEYLRDHEITLKERADLIKTNDINDMNLGGSSSEDRQKINENLHSIRVKVVNIRLSLAALESNTDTRKKLRTCLRDRLGNKRDPFENRDPFNRADINMLDIAVPDEVLEVIKELSNKYRDLEINDYLSITGSDWEANDNLDDYDDDPNGFGGYDFIE